MERKLVGERTREAMRQIAREGRVRSGRLPFGYRTEANPNSVRAVAGDRSRLVEHAEEQRLLRRILELRARDLGARRIAREMTKRSVNPRTDRAWTPSTVQKLVATAERNRS
jgi:DNA invertase Pin-like site-specific DNA recombinase